MLLLAAVTCLVIALFPQWSDQSPTALLSDGGNIAYNLPWMCVAAVASCLLWSRRTMPVAVALFVPVAANQVYGLSSDLLFGPGNLRMGAWFAAVGTALLVGGVLVGWIACRLRLRVDATAIVVAAMATVITLVWIVGQLMPWVKTTATFTAGGYTFRDGQKSVTTLCCTPFANVRWEYATRTAVEFIALLALALVLSLLFPRSAAAAGLAATGVIMLADSIVWLTNLAKRVDLIILFPDYKTRTEGLPVVERIGMIGGWISLIAAVLLILLGVFVLLLSVVQRSHRTSAAEGRVIEG